MFTIITNPTKMKKSLLFSVIFLSLATANAQSNRYWALTEKRADIERAKGTFRSTFPTQYDLYTLNFNQIKTIFFSLWT